MGYGSRLSNPYASIPVPYSALYPASLATYQLISYYHTPSSASSSAEATGFYFAAHDPLGQPKQMQYAVNIESGAVPSSSFGITLIPERAGRSFAGVCVCVCVCEVVVR